ncbi:UDP-glucose 4-epimerase GalE [Cyanobium sp. FGCU-52]|nr:UDP-glucose 4-epimerase GalE [Cyanobium sp. FGCU52]
MEQEADSTVLITGGAGFLGSHATLVLLEAGRSVVVLDDFSNSRPEALRRVAALAGLDGWTATAPGQWRAGPSTGVSLQVVTGDVRRVGDLEAAFAQAPIGAVLHFAGLKAVAESVRQPLRYWQVNVGGSLRLLEAMTAHGCRTLVFSSSATLYGLCEQVPISESAPVQPINPYGSTKAAVERLLADAAASEPGWRIACLRYFNPVGAHPSGRIGEDPSGLPNNLFPLVSQVAVGRLPQLQVYGCDWPTADGTGIRDYIHVMDLAEGHRAALALLEQESPQFLTLNLGSGRGHSVLELVRAFEAASGRPVPWQAAPRRPGDSAVSIADASAAQRRLDWRASRSLDECCRDGWAWQQANPHGYGD